MATACCKIPRQSVAKGLSPLVLTTPHAGCGKVEVVVEVEVEVEVDEEDGTVDDDVVDVEVTVVVVVVGATSSHLPPLPAS